MNRKINLVVTESQNIKELENVSLNNIDSIFSYSCELLVCKVFSIIDNASANQALNALFDKIRPQGQLIIAVVDYERLCYDYVHKKISNEQFFEYIKNVYNYFNINDIIKHMESLSNAMVIDIKTDNYLSYITIVKTKP